MKALLKRLTSQPFVAAATVAVAAGFASVSHPIALVGWSAITPLLAIALLIAHVVSYQFPVHVQRSTKVSMSSVTVFLIATLLPPVIGAGIAGIGVFLGLWLLRTERGLYLSDLMTDAGRWFLVALIGSVVSHSFPTGAPWHPVGLVTAGIILWAGDILTGPLLFHPMTGEPPLQIMRVMYTDGLLTEAPQYLVGLLGALAAAEYPWAIIILLIPVLALYGAYKGTREMQDTTVQILESMADAVDLRDPYTGGHSRRVAAYAAQILRELNLQGHEVELIVSSARIHDIGKIGIPDSVLLKDGRLTPEEQAMMQTHPDRGADLLVRYRDFARGVEIVRHHHERWDGLGYPSGLTGAEIPFGARIIAVADSYDAMTSDRPYRQGMPHEKAQAILTEGRGTQWNAQVVDALLSALKEPVASPVRAVPPGSDEQEGSRSYPQVAASVAVSIADGAAFQ